jgi:hypothetical protein
VEEVQERRMVVGRRGTDDVAGSGVGSQTVVAGEEERVDGR